METRGRFHQRFCARFSYECLFSSYVLRKTRAKTLVKSTQGKYAKNWWDLARTIVRTEGQLMTFHTFDLVGCNYYAVAIEKNLTAFSFFFIWPIRDKKNSHLLKNNGTNLLTSSSFFRFHRYLNGIFKVDFLQFSLLLVLMKWHEIWPFSDTLTDWKLLL